MMSPFIRSEIIAHAEEMGLDRPDQFPWQELPGAALPTREPAVRIFCNRHQEPVMRALVSDAPFPELMDAEDRLPPTATKLISPVILRRFLFAERGRQFGLYVGQCPDCGTVWYF